MLSCLLKPESLHSRLRAERARPSGDRPRLRLTQLVPNTLHAFGQLLEAAFDRVGSQLNLVADTRCAEQGEDLQHLVAAAAEDPETFVLVQTHGKEGEERLLGPAVSGIPAHRLVVFIHRPEELILRVGLEEGLTYPAAKRRLATVLGHVAAVILPGWCCVEEYREMLPGVAVGAIPLGFVPAKHAPAALDTRLRAGAVAVVGSRTSWGEMRSIQDVLGLLKAVRATDGALRVLGYVEGRCDAHANLAQYVGDEDVLFVSSSDLIRAHSDGTFGSEEQFRDWLYGTADGRLVIRARVDNGVPTPESTAPSLGELHQWENRLVDFDVQMYREVLDSRREPGNRGLPKVEYAGSLHGGGAHVIFTVFESAAMRDVQQDEGLTMVHVPVAAGIPDFDEAAARLVPLLRSPVERRRIIERNRMSTMSLGLDEVAFAYCLLLRHLMREGKIL